MTTAGYSGTPLVRKLGIKPGFVVLTVNAPDDYPDLLDPLPEGVLLQVRDNLTAGSPDPVEMAHLFTTKRADLETWLPPLMESIRKDGMIWVSWPKKAAKVSTDITEDVVRQVALPLGLVDTKVCAVDNTWSGLRLVYRRENRR